MYEPLIVCDACARHVKASEAACPFCSHAITTRRIAPDTRRRMTRAAAFVFGATVAVAACGSEVEEPSDDDGSGGAGGVNDAGGNAALYGEPGGFGGVPGSAGAGALYGAPAGGFGGEAGSGGDGGDAGAGGASNLYGAPPP